MQQQQTKQQQQQQQQQKATTTKATTMLHISFFATQQKLGSETMKENEKILNKFWDKGKSEEGPTTKLVETTLNPGVNGFFSVVVHVVVDIVVNVVVVNVIALEQNFCNKILSRVAQNTKKVFVSDWARFWCCRCWCCCCCCWCLSLLSVYLKNQTLKNLIKILLFFEQISSQRGGAFAKSHAAAVTAKMFLS